MVWSTIVSITGSHSLFFALCVSLVVIGIGVAVA